LKQRLSRNDSLPAPSPFRNGLMALLTAPDTQCIALVPVHSLVAGDSPRFQGVDIAHAEMLADLENELPPILVQRSSMRVIDGMHRLHAAQLCGRENIRVQFCDCDEDEAFLLAVVTNVTHGMPLTLAEKRAAAARIVRMRPDASDRWIAQVSGLAAATIAAVRQANMDQAPAPDRRVGKDGRIRPLSTSDGRRIARDMLEREPGASLRQVARAAGISVGTARDVKEKIRLGIDPLQTKQLTSRKREKRGLAKARSEDSQADIDLILQRLRRDPSLRYTESGQSVLRWLSPRLLQLSKLEEVVDSIPSRWVSEMIRIAYGCAGAWIEFAEQLEDRSHDTSRDLSRRRGARL
jgi:ParB-like chromosome segregation protein Spo0J